jgi:arginine-tRNA-protein transferase
MACALVDVMGDGLSLVYSFYDPAVSRRSLGSFVILDHVIQAELADLPYVYLGYWVRGSEKMDYKVRFSPIELLKPEGWTLVCGRDLTTRDAG